MHMNINPLSFSAPKLINLNEILWWKISTPFCSEMVCYRLCVLPKIKKLVYACLGYFCHCDKITVTEKNLKKEFFGS